MPIKYVVEGADRILRKTRPEFVRGPLERFFSRSGTRLLAAAREVAPIDTGRLAGSLSQRGPGNIWEQHPWSLTVGTNVNAYGFPYPKALDESPRYHYRGGSAGGVVHPLAVGLQHAGRAGLYGQPTQGWWTQTMRNFAGQIGKYLQEMGREIYAAWERR